MTKHLWKLAVPFALLMALLLSACGGTASGGTLIMATNAEFPPYEYHESDAIVGIDAELAAKIAEKLGMTLVIDDMEFGSIIGAVQSGKAGIGMAGMTVDADRLVNVNFTDSYATGVQVIIVPEGSPITTLDDLAGKLIGVQETTTGDIYATDDFGDDAVERYSKGADAVLALTTGKVDAVIIDNEPAKNFVAVNPGLTILETPYAEEDYAICVAKENTQLLNDINKALAELKADGTLAAIIEKYIPSK